MLAKQFFSYFIIQHLKIFSLLFYQKDVLEIVK